MVALLTEALVKECRYGSPAVGAAEKAAVEIAPMLAVDLVTAYRAMREEPTYQERLRNVWFAAISTAIEKKAGSLVSTMKQADLIEIMKGK
jgi:hypothetical protein